MIRRAIVIGVGAAKNEAPLPGTYQDIEELQRYLTSIAGGAWESSEIRALRDPTRPAVLDAKRWLAGADFSFVSFSGHGCERGLQHSSGLRYSMTCMVCADGQEVQRAELTPNDGKSVVLLDCCRVLQPISSKTAGVGAITLDSRQRPIDRQLARQLFERAVSAAQLGPELLYGCQFDGTASDLPSFTSSLVASARGWSERSSGILDLSAAFQLAAKVHEQVSPGRKPTIDLGRSSFSRPVPFAVGSQMPRIG